VFLQASSGSPLKDRDDDRLKDRDNDNKDAESGRPVQLDPEKERKPGQPQGEQPDQPHGKPGAGHGQKPGQPVK
jgi:hypothetical protein